MKLKLLLLLLSASLGFSQTAITKFESAAQSEYAVVTSTLNQSATGAGLTWNFNVAYDNDDTSDVLSSPTSAELSSYPNATNVIKTSNASNEVVSAVYMNKSGTSAEFVGVESSGIKLNYINPGVLGDFPLSFMDSNSNAISGTFDYNGSINGSFSGTITSKVDAYGTLNVDVSGLVGEDFNGSVTRLKVVQDIELSAFVTADMIQTSYYYYASNGDLVFRTSDIQITGVINDTSSFIETLKSSSLGIEDQKQKQLSFSTFPNPVNNELNFKIDAEIESISIVDISGRVVLKVETDQPNLSVSQLNSGLYIANISTDKGLFSRKFVKK